MSTSATIEPVRGLGTSMDRRILGLALPALGSLIVEPLYNVTDTAIVGHLGRGPLGGLALAATVLNLLGWTSAFLQMATTSQVAYRRGQDDDTGVTAAVTAAYVVALALGLLVAVLVATVGPELTRLLGGHGEVQRNATTYLRISAVGMPFLLLTLAGTGHAQGHEDTRSPLRIVLVANLLNVALELVLVYGLGLGVAGSAWGTVVAQVIAAALFVGVSRRKLTTSLVRPGRDEYAVLLHNGVALVIRTIALGAALAASTAIAAQIGSDTLGGHQIALQVWILLALTLDALAVPAQVYVGTALGRGDIEDAAQIGRRCLQLGLVASAAVGVLTMALSPVLPFIFSGDSGVRSVAMTGLLLCGALQPFAAIAFVLDGLLLGASDYGVLRRSMLLALIAFAPLAAATLADHDLGITGIWLAITCWLAARCVLLGLRWKSRRWAYVRDARTSPAAR
jgi:putative MATE family efflux protein